MAWIKAMIEVAGYKSAGYEEYMKERAIDFLEMVLMGTEE